MLQKKDRPQCLRHLLQSFLYYLNFSLDQQHLSACLIESILHSLKIHNRKCYRHFFGSITSKQKENLITSHNNIIQYLQEGKTDEAQKEIVNHYKLADSIIQSTTNHSTRQSIEKILSKLYSEGFNDEQILSRLSSFSQ